VLGSQSAVVESSISNLRTVSNFLEDKMTAEDLPVKAALQRAVANLTYEKELIDSFKDELSK
jgi:hypothetical protein